MTSPAKSTALAIAPKFTAVLSICGNLAIVLKVLFNKSRREKTMHRLVLGMSICDTLASIWYFTSTWAIPAGTLSRFGDGETEQIFWAAGDEDGVSCSFAGFFNQFAVATPLYNSTLAIYYLLVVNFGWSDGRIAKMEWILHVIPFGYALITSIFAVAADLYGHVEWTCWVLPSELFDESQELTPIQSKYQLIQWIFLFGVVWSCIIVVTTVFVILYRKMKSLERKLTQYAYSSTGSHTTRDWNKKSTHQLRNNISKGEFNSSTDFSLSSKNKADILKDEAQSQPGREPEDHDIEEAGSTNVSGDENDIGKYDGTEEPDPKSNDSNGDLAGRSDEKDDKEESRPREVAKSRKIAVQGLLYVGAFYITWMFPTISRITELVAKKNYFPIQFLDTFFIPLQGFFNCMIYIRPKYLKYRHQGNSFWKASTMAVFEIKID